MFLLDTLSYDIFINKLSYRFHDYLNILHIEVSERNRKFEAEKYQIFMLVRILHTYRKNKLSFYPCDIFIKNLIWWQSVKIIRINIELSFLRFVVDRKYVIQEKVR